MGQAKAPPVERVKIVVETFVFTEREALVQRLEELNTEVDTSYAVVVIEKSVGERDLLLVREAVKLCDRVVVAGVGLKVTKTAGSALKKAGVDAVFTPAASKWLCKVETGVKEMNGTLILVTILAVLPNVVMVHRDSLALLRTLRNLQQTFGDLFALREVKG
jgi:hypothetical protein